MKKLSISEGKIIKRHPAEPASKNHAPPHLQNPGLNHVLALQQQVGNRTVQRLVGQRNSQEASELDDETTQQIEHERGGVVIQGRIPGRLLAQFSPWQAKPMPAENTLENVEDGGMEEV